MAGEGFKKFSPFILKKMLEDGNELSVFRLPRNQRKYAWGERNRVEMWDDLKRFRENMFDEHDRRSDQRDLLVILESYSSRLSLDLHNLGGPDPGKTPTL